MYTHTQVVKAATKKSSKDKLTKEKSNARQEEDQSKGDLLSKPRETEERQSNLKVAKSHNRKEEESEERDSRKKSINLRQVSKAKQKSDSLTQSRISAE